MAVFFQVGALISFFQGMYNGDYSFADLAKQGNFGLGTLNGVDGEVIAIDRAPEAIEQPTDLGSFYNIFLIKNFSIS